MKKIRQNVFETNSSSTHSIAILPDGWNMYINHGGYYCDTYNPYIPIMIEDNLSEEANGNPYYRRCIITTSDWYKRIDGYYLVKGDLQKIQFLVSRLNSILSNLFYINLEQKDLSRFKQITKAIEDYLTEKYNIRHIKIVDREEYSGGYFLKHLYSSYSWIDDKQYTKKEIYDIMKKVISDDKIVFICHSDESGPYPEDINLIQVDDNLRLLLKK